MNDIVHPALERAREARRSGEMASPSGLYGLAEGDGELYRHAMIEAGLLIPKDQVGDEPEDPCPVCGWSLLAEILVDPAKVIAALPEDERREYEEAQESIVRARRDPLDEGRL